MTPPGPLPALLLLILAAAGELRAQAPTLTTPLGMELVLIRPGSLVVGRFQPECPAPEATRDQWSAEDHRLCREMVARDARPGFLARVERPFYIGRYEVTQAEWRRVMGSNPSTFRGERHPVQGVSWADAQAFVRRLNRLEPGARYRLPTELEWEYAARAGADAEPSWAEINRSAWIARADKGSPQPVGGMAPNAWGLHDTLGNVWEWVEDRYNEKLFPDPTVTLAGRERVLRGGGFLSDVKNATPFTHAGGPGSGFDVGFRVVREVR